MQKYQVIIAGGSFAGLALATALAQADLGPDFRVAVVDRVFLKTTLNAMFDGRATSLSSASQNMLQQLGIWAALEDQVQEISDIDITDSALDAAVRPVFLHFDRRDEKSGSATVIVENHVLRRAIAKTALATDSIDFFEGVSVEAFSADVAGGVEVRLSDDRVLHGQLLVAADGRKSALRQMAGIKTVSWSYPQSGIVTTVRHERPHNGRAVQHFLPAGPFAILPLTGNRSSLVWTEERSRAAALMALDDEWFLDELTRRFGHKLGTLELSGPRGSWPLDMILARSFCAARLALIGDAAHGVHPIAGQGLNIGLRDVAALAQVIAETSRLGLDFSGPEPLQRYERWRRFDAATLAMGMDALNRLFSNDAEPLRILRSTGLSLVDRLPGLKRFFVSEAAGASGKLPNLLKGEAI